MRWRQVPIFLLCLFAFRCASQSEAPEAQPPSSVSQPPAPPVDPPNFEKEEGASIQPRELDLRIQEAIQSTLSMQVDATDPLGEGEGAFDPDPRIPTTRIDCMTWLQWVLAQAYSGPDEDPLLWLDALRYYGGVVSFDTRKHYVDRWLWMEPGPLDPVECPDEICLNETIRLEISGIPAQRGYPCRLWRDPVREIDLQMIPQDRLVDVIEDLSPGFYVLFGLASERYLQLYGEHSGPMAQVHPALLHVQTHGAQITHASTALERVATVELNAWMQANRRLHRGSTIYALDPTWTPQAGPLFITEESRCSVR